MRFFVFIFVASMSLTACQTSPLRQFSDVKPGMEKSQVLDIMGTPWTTTRLHGKDRWIYVIYDNGIRTEREVHFQNGAAVYVGEAWTPEESKQAEVQDKTNEELEKQIKEESLKIKQENKNAYSDYEKEVRGQGKKVKYIPDFEALK
jgi:outer membrane protein assembly factor BamE